MQVSIFQFDRILIPQKFNIIHRKTVAFIRLRLDADSYICVLFSVG